MSDETKTTPRKHSEILRAVPVILLSILLLETVRVFLGPGASLVVAAVVFVLCVLVDRRLEDG